MKSDGGKQWASGAGLGWSVGWMHELGAVYPSDGTLQVMDVGSTAANVGHEAMGREWVMKR